MSNAIGKENSLRLSNDSDDFEINLLNNLYVETLNKIKNLILKLLNYINDKLFPFINNHKNIFINIYIQRACGKIYFYKYVSDLLILLLKKIDNEINKEKYELYESIENSIDKNDSSQSTEYIINKKTIMKCIYNYFINLKMIFLNEYHNNFTNRKKKLSKNNKKELELLENCIYHINYLYGYSDNILSKYDNFSSDIFLYINKKK